MFLLQGCLAHLALVDGVSRQELPSETQDMQCMNAESNTGLSSTGVLVHCRATIEANINAVARGARTKESVLQEAVDFFKADFISASHKQSTLLHVCSYVDIVLLLSVCLRALTIVSHPSEQTNDSVHHNSSFIYIETELLT